MSTSAINFKKFVDFFSPKITIKNTNYEKIIILDTSSILKSNANIIKKFTKKDMVIVPNVVISELNHIYKKNINTTLGRKAKHALNELNNFRNNKIIVPLPQTIKFDGLDANDKKILYRAIEYKKKFDYPVIIVTQDKKFASVAKINDIETEAYPFN